MKTIYSEMPVIFWRNWNSRQKRMFLFSRDLFFECISGIMEMKMKKSTDLVQMKEQKPVKTFSSKKREKIFLPHVLVTFWNFLSNLQKIIKQKFAKFGIEIESSFHLEIYSIFSKELIFSFKTLFFLLKKNHENSFYFLLPSF